MAQILPSIFGADIMHLQAEIDFLEEEQTNILHVDLMDGNFVANIAFGPNQIAEMKKNSTMTLSYISNFWTLLERIIFKVLFLVVILFFGGFLGSKPGVNFCQKSTIFRDFWPKFWSFFFFF